MVMQVSFFIYICTHKDTCHLTSLRQIIKKLEYEAVMQSNEKIYMFQEFERIQPWTE